MWVYLNDDHEDGLDKQGRRVVGGEVKADSQDITEKEHSA